MRISAAIALLASCFLCAAQAPAKNREGFPARPRTAAPQDRKAVLDGNLSFALDLHGRLRGQPGNVVCSPFSVSAVMAMMAAGARGETRDQLMTAMKLELAPARVDRAFQSVLANIAPDVDSPVKLDVANALWTGTDTPMKRRFIRSLLVRYGARATSLDFAGDPEGSREEINQWVSRLTHGRIPEVLEPGALGPYAHRDEAAFVLTDAVVFDGKWAKPFLLDTTRLHPFTRSDGSQVAIPLMHAQGRMEGMRGPGFQAIDVPYEGDEYSMTILVPDEPDGLPAIEDALSPKDFSAWIEGLSPTNVTLFLPGFETRSDIDLVGPLQGMGVTDAFDRGRADFSGAAGDPGEVVLKSIRQKALITVTEEGTEAMAVTTALFVVLFAIDDHETVVVDRPFLFVIRHRPTGTILFIGRIEDPSL